MYPINRLMVGLDLTEMDDKLISYLPILEEIFKPDTIYFVHVTRSLRLPQRIREKYPDLMAPVDESLENVIRTKVENNYTPKGDVTLRYAIREGEPIKETLNWSEIKEVDLFVMGFKTKMKGEGKLAYKLARVAHCSIYFVPEEVPTTQIRRVLVPVDFSRNSANALKFAMELNEKLSCQIILQNSYEVPSGYSSTGKSYEEFAEIMKKNAMDDALEYLRKLKIPADEVKIALTLDEEEDPAERAFEEATAHQADLIVIASRGRTELASILLGSVAEKMIRYDSDIPLMIYKNKKENLGFFQALLRI